MITDRTIKKKMGEGGGGGGGGGFSLVPRPRFPKAAGGLHHRYVESGFPRSGDVIHPPAVGNLGLGMRLGRTPFLWQNMCPSVTNMNVHFMQDCSAEYTPKCINVN